MKNVIKIIKKLVQNIVESINSIKKILQNIEFLIWNLLISADRIYILMPQKIIVSDTMAKNQLFMHLKIVI